MAGDERVELVVESLAKYHKKLTMDDSDSFLGNQMQLLMTKERAALAAPTIRTRIFVWSLTSSLLRV